MGQRVTPTPDELQAAVQQYWDARPCDSGASRLPPGTQSYFEEIEKDRYAHQGHVLELLNQIDWRGKQVLEIGTGVGTDARQLIARGADYEGINLDEGSSALTRRALAAFGLAGRVQAMDATAMRFADATFDVVYSFGVLHHIPDAERALAEIHRVLKSDGLLLFMVYNRSSINYQLEIRLLRRWGLQVLILPGAIPLLSRLGFPREKLERHLELSRALGRMSDEEWLSRNTDGPDNPYSRVYSRADVEKLLAGRFRILRQQVWFFDPRHWGPPARLLPRAALRFLGRRWGWHRIALAQRL